MSRSALLLTAFVTWGTTSGPVIGQVFDQGPGQTRTFQVPEMAREAVGHVHGTNTEDIFGFTLGSDTEEQGAKILETENIASFGSRDQTYTGINNKIQFTYGVTDYFTASLGLLGGYWNIRNRGPGHSATETGETVPTEDAFTQVNNYRFAGIGGELRLNLVKRSENFVLDSFKAYSNPSTEKTSAFGLSGALTYQWFPGFFFGGEIRWLRSYDGMGLNNYQGQAVFLGPSLFWDFADDAYLSAAFSWQVTGNIRGEASTINLVNFQRQQLKFKLVYEF
jgi:hypothetical protein